jgi:hypothetical protein
MIYYLHSNTKEGIYKVWLMQFKLDSSESAEVSYAKSSRGGLALLRKGTPEIKWDIDRNVVLIKTASNLSP